MKKITTNLKKYSYWTSVIVIGIVIGVSFRFVKAWIEPTVQAPGGNVGTPLNISRAGQTKASGITLNTGNVPNGLIVANGNVGIGTVYPQKKLDVAGNASISGNLDIGLERVKKTVTNAPDSGIAVYCPTGKTVIYGDCRSLRNGEGYAVPVTSNVFSNNRGEGWSCVPADGLSGNDRDITVVAICGRFDKSNANWFQF